MKPGPWSGRAERERIESLKHQHAPAKRCFLVPVPHVRTRSHVSRRELYRTSVTHTAASRVQTKPPLLFKESRSCAASATQQFRSQRPCKATLIRESVRCHRSSTCALSRRLPRRRCRHIACCRLGWGLCGHRRLLLLLSPCSSSAHPWSRLGDSRAHFNCATLVLALTKQLLVRARRAKLHMRVPERLKCCLEVIVGEWQKVRGLSKSLAVVVFGQRLFYAADNLVRLQLWHGHANHFLACRASRRHRGLGRLWRVFPHKVSSLEELLYDVV